MAGGECAPTIEGSRRSSSATSAEGMTAAYLNFTMAGHAMLALGPQIKNLIAGGVGMKFANIVGKQIRPSNHTSSIMWIQVQWMSLHNYGVSLSMPYFKPDTLPLSCCVILIFWVR